MNEKEYLEKNISDLNKNLDILEENYYVVKRNQIERNLDLDIMRKKFEYYEELFTTNDRRMAQICEKQREKLNMILESNNEYEEACEKQYRLNNKEIQNKIDENYRMITLLDERSFE